MTFGYTEWSVKPKKKVKKKNWKTSCESSWYFILFLDQVRVTISYTGAMGWDEVRIPIGAVIQFNFPKANEKTAMSEKKKISRKKKLKPALQIVTGDVYPWV